MLKWLTNHLVKGWVEATKFITTGGTSSDFVKGDGSLDDNTYATETYVDDSITAIPQKSLKDLYDELDSSSPTILNEGNVRKKLYFNNLSVSFNNDTLGNFNYNNLIGFDAGLNLNKTGSDVANQNVVLGDFAAYSSAKSVGNVLVGNNAGVFSQDLGSSNVYIGAHVASYSKGQFNVAIGYQALNSENIGANDFNIRNTAVGSGSMKDFISGNRNNGFGDNSLISLTDGSGNTANGNRALGLLKTGNNNTALGFDAGLNIIEGSNNTIIGRKTFATNTVINNEVILADGANNTVLRSNGLVGNIEAPNSTTANIDSGSEKTLISKEWFTENLPTDNNQLTNGAGYLTSVAWNDIIGTQSNINLSGFNDDLDYDNYGSWNLKTNGVQRTTIQSGGTLDLEAGTNISLSYGAGGQVTINSSFNDTTYTAGTGLDLTGTTFSFDTAWGDGRYLQSFTETDPMFQASPAAGITNTNITNWNAAFNWGDHSQVGYATEDWVNGQGYLTSETDPVFTASPAYGISNIDINNWNKKGVQLTADQPNANIHLKDSAGNTISTLNVGFLNNEGTNISFNSTTDEIELKNDEGVLLSSFPASSLMTGVGIGLNLTGSTLELTDSANNVVDSVTLTIPNIQGLQSALDDKVDKVAGKGLSSNDFSDEILDYYNEYLDGSHRYLRPESTITLSRAYEDSQFPTLRDKIVQALLDASGYVTIDARGVNPSLPNGDFLIDGIIIIDKPCKIIFPSGNIIYKNTVNEPMFDFRANSIFLEGSGRSASSGVSAAVTKLIMGSDAPNNYHIYGRGVSTMTLKSFDLIGVQTSAVDAVYPNLDGKGGIYFEKPNPGTVSGGNTVNQCVIDDLYIEGTYAHGIYLDTAILSRISNTRVSSAGAHGIFIHKGTSMSLQNIYVSSANKGGIVMYQHSYSSLINCVAEYAGIGFWLRSCNAINMFASGTEMNKNIGQTIPNTDIPTTDNQGNPVIISDIGSSHETSFWRGHSYCITGGQNITMINPFSTNPGRAYNTGLSTQSRHFLIRGNAEDITIISPSLNMSSGETWGGRFDIEISEWGGQAPTGLYLKWNPEDGVTVPTTAGKFITDNDHSSESTNILNEASTDAVIFDSLMYYTVNYPSGDTIYDKLDRGTYLGTAKDLKDSIDSKALKTTTLTAGTGLTGGGDLSADRTLSVKFGTSSGTVAVGNDSRFHSHSNKTVLDGISSDDISKWNDKQDKLTAGDGISISGTNVISSTAGGESLFEIPNPTETAKSIKSKISGDVLGRGQIVIGRDASAVAGNSSNGIALGTLSEISTSAYGTIAIGALANSSNRASIALGAGTKTFRDDELSLSSTDSRTSSNNTYVAGVRNPQHAYDAANKDYVDQQEVKVVSSPTSTVTIDIRMYKSSVINVTNDFTINLTQLPNSRKSIVHNITLNYQGTRRNIQLPSGSATNLFGDVLGADPTKTYLVTIEAINVSITSSPIMIYNIAVSESIQGSSNNSRG